MKDAALFEVPADATSWVELDPMGGYPIQHLPYGRFRVPGCDSTDVGVRIGDWALSLNHAAVLDRLSDVQKDAVYHLAEPRALNVQTRAALRAAACGLLRSEAKGQDALRRALTSVTDVEMLPLFRALNFVDFYSGIHHASNVGKMFRPDQPPLLPNYRHMPIGYNGRSSTLYVSGTPVTRPRGIVKPAVGDPVYVPSSELDFELEVGFVLADDFGHGPLSPELVELVVLGVVMVNDWSARDVQRFEYQPLGPFLGKSFATTIGAWVTPIEALRPFRVRGLAQDPEPLPHLRDQGPSHYDVELTVTLECDASRHVISRTNLRELYWTFGQQLAHLTSNGARLEPGDLCASGTVSGPEPGTFGSMLELSWRGTQPVPLGETGRTRVWIEDGDTVILRGRAATAAFAIELAPAAGTVLPAR